MQTETYTSALSTTQQQVDDLVRELLPSQGQWSEEAYLCLADHTTIRPCWGLLPDRIGWRERKARLP